MIVWGAWKDSVSKAALKNTNKQPVFRPYCIIRNSEKTIHLFDQEADYVKEYVSSKADRSRQRRK